MNSKVLNDLKGVFHPRSLANITANPSVEPLDVELETADSKRVVRFKIVGLGGFKFSINALAGFTISVQSMQEQTTVF